MPTSAGKASRPIHTTPRDTARVPEPGRAVAALDAEGARLEREYGTLHVPWGEVVRLRRGSLNLPGNGAPSELGAIRTSGWAHSRTAPRKS